MEVYNNGTYKVVVVKATPVRQRVSDLEDDVLASDCIWPERIDNRTYDSWYAVCNLATGVEEVRGVVLPDMVMKADIMLFSLNSRPWENEIKLYKEMLSSVEEDKQRTVSATPTPLN